MLIKINVLVAVIYEILRPETEIMVISHNEAIVLFQLVINFTTRK